MFIVYFILKILFEVVTEEREGKAIIKIIVASGHEKPYYIAKRGMNKDDFFSGLSLPKNKELMQKWKNTVILLVVIFE